MRRIFFFAAAMSLAGCATQAPQPEPVKPPPVVETPVVRSDLIGMSAGDLIQRMGQPALQVREGSGLKLQFRGRSCILDAYLYPPAQRKRAPSFVRRGRQACLASAAPP